MTREFPSSNLPGEPAYTRALENSNLRRGEFFAKNFHFHNAHTLCHEMRRACRLGQGIYVSRGGGENLRTNILAHFTMMRLRVKIIRKGDFGAPGMWEGRYIVWSADEGC